jgi:hypothetical protein
MNKLIILLAILIIAGVASLFDIRAEEGNKGMSSGNTGNEKIVIRTDENSISKGKVLFEQLCTKCHNTENSYPKGDVNIRAPGLKGLLKEDLLPYSKKPATAENILNQLNKSFDKMPSFHFLSEDEQLNIIAFLNTV